MDSSPPGIRLVVVIHLQLSAPIKTILLIKSVKVAQFSAFCGPLAALVWQKQSVDLYSTEGLPHLATFSRLCRQFTMCGFCRWSI
jgi:hypothetical protein